MLPLKALGAIPRADWPGLRLGRRWNRRAITGLGSDTTQGGEMSLTGTALSVRPYAHMNKSRYMETCRLHRSLSSLKNSPATVRNRPTEREQHRQPWHCRATVPDKGEDV